MAAAPAPDIDIGRKIKKRKYSRKGCVECKRRKIKCDEAEPECNNCSRLNKACAYPRGTLPDHTPVNGRDGAQPAISEVGRGLLNVKFYQPKPAESSHLQGPRDVSDHRRTDKKLGESSIGNLLNTSLMLGSSSPLQQSEILPSFLPLDMQNLQENVNVFLDDFYLNHQMSPEGLTESGNDADTSPKKDSSEIALMASGTNLPAEALALPQQDSDATQNTESHHRSGKKQTTRPQNHMESASPSGEPDFSIADFPLDRDLPESAMAPGSLAKHLLLPLSTLIEQCVRENSLGEPHVYYLRLLTETDLSFHLFPFAALVETNGVTKLLLAYLVRCTYLLTSLLALSATLQFIRTSENRHDHALHFYTRVCFKALTNAFTSDQFRNSSAVFASSIEQLLLTVLIMSTRFITTSTLLDTLAPSSWKDHLRGARDLLVRYSEMTVLSLKQRSEDHEKDKTSHNGWVPKASESHGEGSSRHLHHKTPYMSPGLALAKCWFFAIETSAAMHTAVGGALSRASAWNHNAPHVSLDVYLSGPDVDIEKEYHILVDTGSTEPHANRAYHWALLRVNLVCGSASGGVFNLYWGFNSSFLPPLLAFVSFTDAVKLRGLPHVPFRWTMHLLGLLDALLKERVVPDVCLRTFVIPKTSPGHPNYDGATPVRLPQSCFVTIAGEVFSWFDAAHQFHGDYLTLRVMVSQSFLALPRSHPDVQYIIRKIFDGAFFIQSKTSPQYEAEKHLVITESAHYYLSKHSFDIRCVMVQLVFRLISGIVVDEDHFERIELYFLGLLMWGNGSSLKSLDMVARTKMLREANREKLNGRADEHIYDFYDSMNDIPFS